MGSVRAKNGRHDPWDIKYVEIGNEDYLTGGCATYPERFTQIYDAIHGTYPDLTLVASTIEQDCLPSPLPANVLVDVHYYSSPDVLVSKFDQYDNVPRDRGVIVGEWGCRNTTAERGQFWGFMQGSCSEAVHMIGFERNSDVIKMTTYAPLLQNFAFTQWSVRIPSPKPSVIVPKGILVLINIANPLRLRLKSRIPHALYLLLRAEDVR